MARLPIPGGDNGDWGEVLNQFLSVEHKSDGSLKQSDAINQAITDAANAVSASEAAVTAAESSVQSVNGKTPNVSGAVTLTASDISGIPDDTAVVHKASTETITGNKDFTGTLTHNSNAVVDTTDSRLADQRVPTDGSVTNAKIVSGGLSPVSITGQAEVKTAKGAANGYASLNASTQVPTAQLGSGTASSSTYLRGDGTWAATPTAPVTSVNTQTGAVLLDADAINDASTTNKFTNAADITKLAGIAAGAEVNINADWNAVSGDALILNKPTLGTAAAASTSDFATASQGALANTAEQTANKGAASGYAGLNAASLVPTSQLGSGAASSSTYLRGDGTWTAAPTPADATTSTKGIVQLAGDLGGTATSPTVPGLASKANTTDVTAIDARVTQLEGNAISPIGTDNVFFGDLFSSAVRASCSSQETLSVGFESFSGGAAPISFTATKLRFHVRAVAPAGRTVTFAVYTGSSRTSLTKRIELTVTSSLATLGLKEVALSPSVTIARGEFVYLDMLTTGSGTPDPALSTTALVSSDLINAAPGVIMMAYKSGQSSLPATLNVNNGYTGDGRVFWFALAA